MQRILLILSALLTYISAYPYFICSSPTSIIADSVMGANVCLCAEDYNENTLNTYTSWNITLVGNADAWQISGHIELEQVNYDDYILISEVDDNGAEVKRLASYVGIVEDITLIASSGTGRLRIYMYCHYGATQGTSGFNLYITPIETTNAGRLLVTERLGIGTSSPQANLHIVGDIKLESPITAGTATCDIYNNQVRLSTDRTAYSFDKPLINNSGSYIVPNQTNTYFKTYNDTTLAILANGNIGIGVTSPQTKLQIVGGGLKLGETTSISDRTSAILQFGDGNYVQIGEWEKDDVLSFKATSYKFTNGKLGININTTTPQAMLDVNGYINAKSAKIPIFEAETIYSDTISADTLSVNSLFVNTITCADIKAQSIIVETQGADYVFDQNYHLPTLNEAHQYIKQNGHLYGIPSATQMQSGVDMVELQTLLLRKIEELMLYIIEQDKRIKALENKEAYNIP